MLDTPKQVLGTWLLFAAPRFWVQTRARAQLCQGSHKDPRWKLTESAQGVLMLPPLPRTRPHSGGVVISSLHGTAQWEEVESSILLFILKVKYVSQNNVNGFIKRQVQGGSE